VYVWLWRRLPGPLAVRALQCLVLFAGVTLLLFFVVFPWAEPKLPFGNVTVEPRSDAPGPTEPGPVPTGLTSSPGPTGVPTTPAAPLPAPTALPGE
jgi:hypothetical protein